MSDKWANSINICVGFSYEALFYMPSCESSIDFLFVLSFFSNKSKKPNRTRIKHSILAESVDDITGNDQQSFILIGHITLLTGDWDKRPWSGQTSPGSGWKFELIWENKRLSWILIESGLNFEILYHKENIPTSQTRRGMLDEAGRGHATWPMRGSPGPETGLLHPQNFLSGERDKGAFCCVNEVTFPLAPGHLRVELAARGAKQWLQGWTFAFRPTWSPKSRKVG